MEDTSPRARARYFEMLRKRSPDERLSTAAALTTAVRRLAEAGIRQRNPKASDLEVRNLLVELVYGKATAERLASRSRDQ